MAAIIPYKLLAAFSIPLRRALSFTAGIFTLIPMMSVRPRRSYAWGIALRL